MSARQDARTRILLFFLLGIALPSGLLGYLAWRGIQNDRALVERERRLALERAADGVSEAADSLLLEIGRAVSAAAPDDLSRLVRERPEIRAVFTVRPGSGVRIVAADGLLFERSADPADAEPKGNDAFEALFRSAREREVGAADPGSALELYRRALAEASDAPSRARALGGAARTQRKLGRWTEAATSYERLRDELGDVSVPGTVPSGAAASLELGSVLLQTGDTVRARRVLLEMYEDLVAGRWRVTPARFDFLSTRVTDALAALPRAAESDVPGDRLEALASRAAEARERARSLLRFEERAGELLGNAGPGARRISVEAAERSFPAVLLATGPDTAGPERRGFVVDLPALARAALARANGAATQPEGGLAWTLRDRAGQAVDASSASPATDAPATSVALGGFAPWTLELGPPASAAEDGFFTSRRAVYFYAFVLLAGILLFGLTLTVRSLARELELARMKSDFVSTVSHEFKSPLTSIRQMAEMLSSGRVPSEERRRRYYDVLLEQSERLSMLVDTVLDFARMESGRHELEREEVDVEELVRDTVADARSRVAHEGFTIRTEIEAPLPPTHLDPAAVRQALANLVDNGVKYSGSSREVVVRAYADGGEMVVAVRDFGIGLAEAEKERVFERFYRAGDELTRSVKGTGLGLTLVERIVDAHGGSVDVRSETGEGSTFSMRFPINSAGAPSAAEPTR